MSLPKETELAQEVIRCIEALEEAKHPWNDAAIIYTRNELETMIESAQFTDDDLKRVVEERPPFGSPLHVLQHESEKMKEVRRCLREAVEHFLTDAALEKLHRDLQLTEAMVDPRADGPYEKDHGMITAHDRDSRRPPTETQGMERL